MIDPQGPPGPLNKDVRIATYNIHRCRGMDRRVNPGRIIDVLRDINAVSRYPIVHHSQYDLSWRTCESRNCQRADLNVNGQVLHIYNVHLGTAVLERRYQAKRLASFVHDHRVSGPKIILGDFNEWMKGLATKTLSALFESVDISQHLKRRRTYPGLFPVVHLDHIAVIVERKAGDVDGLGAAGGLLVDDDRDRAAFHSLAEGQTAPAGETRVREPFELLTRFYYMEGAHSAPARSGVLGPRERRAGCGAKPHVITRGAERGVGAPRATSRGVGRSPT